MLDLTTIPTELLTLFQNEAREAFYELRATQATKEPHRSQRRKEILYLLRGNAEALGIRPWVEQIRAAHQRLQQTDGSEAEGILNALEQSIVTSFKDAGWEARREKVDGVPSIYLYPGYVYVTAKPVVASTVLGSCVSVCLWDDGARVGGLNHFLLPGDEQATSTKYAAGAMRSLLDQFIAQGGRRAGAKAKIFGGARLVAGASDVRVPLGTENAARAEAFLTAAGIPVVERHVGGMQGRKLTFDMKNGATKITTV